MEYISYQLLLLIFNVSDVLSVLCSRTTYTYYSSTTYFPCNYGCCGSSRTRYCCSSSTVNARFSGGSTAGIVIGILFVIFCLIIITYLCKRKRYYGRVMRPGAVAPQQVQTVHVSHTSGTMMGQPRQAYPPMYQPPAYGQTPMSYPQPPQPMRQQQQQPIHSAPLDPGYVPPPPSYSAPPPGYNAPPPAYNQIQGYPPGYYPPTKQ
ncbi:protein shisa-5-like [Haliotis rufescens]|uniref:protein shisa-5-like n=1 Tax=Haliotis rufescens TaxID=6454 RepID=UPI001EB05F56|nr:protein shisa-5-like [Haliotis rufescens]